jgi:hypothetical protein
MKRTSFWMPIVAGVVLAGGLICGGIAQVRADETPATVQAAQLPGGGPATMKAGANVAYVLQGGTLIKYGTDAKQIATLTLAEKPAQNTQTQGQPPMGPPPPRGEMLVTGDTVLVILGDSFFNVNGATMTITAKGTLPTIERPQPPQGQGNQQGMRGQGGQNGQQGMRGQGQGQGRSPGGSGGQGGPGQDGPGGPGGQGMRGGQGNQQEQGQGGPGGPGGQGMRGNQGNQQGQGQCGPGGPGGPGMMGGPGMPPQLQLELAGHTLFVLRGPQLLAINIDTGAVAVSDSGTSVTIN